MRSIGFIVVIASLIAACQPAPRPEPGAAPDVRAQPALIRVRAIYPETAPLVANATLDVQLIGESAPDAAPVTIARTRFDRARASPYDFDLAYDNTKVETGTRYSLRATVRNASGHLELVTDKRVVVVPGTMERVEIRLLRAASNR